MKLKRILASVVIFQLFFYGFSRAVTMAQALTSRSATASTYIERGNAWFAKGDYEHALADFDLAVASDPNYAEAYYNRGITRFRMGNYERAIADFNRVIQINPRFIKAYINR